MSKWAATNALRVAASCKFDCSGHEPTQAALALVEAALDAAERRAEFGHDEHCAWVIGGRKPPPCDCGHDDLAAALRAVRESK